MRLSPGLTRREPFHRTRSRAPGLSTPPVKSPASSSQIRTTVAQGKQSGSAPRVKESPRTPQAIERLFARNTILGITVEYVGP